MIKTILKRFFLINTISSLSIWTLVYLIRSFVIWKLTNPFQWIIDIPTYSSGDRMGIIMSYLGYLTIIGMLAVMTTIDSKPSLADRRTYGG